MHTSSSVDNIDEYLETIVKKPDGLYYRYGTEERPIVQKRIVVPYLRGERLIQKEFIVYRTHHGPIVREANGKWVSVRLMEEPLKALMQSYLRTKAKTYKEFRETMELHTNSSNNTIYADADGTIAYFHSNFPQTRPAVRLDQTRGREQPGDRVERGARDRRNTRPDESTQRVALQHEQLPVVGGGAE
jgi:acyl-homoserine lactone acylase PvdQ